MVKILVCVSPISIKIVADIIDNAKEITRFDPDFAPRFLDECALLMKSMTRGHEALKEMAWETIKQEKLRR